MFHRDCGRYVLRELCDGLISISLGFCQEILIISDQLCFQILVRVESFPIFCDQLRNVIGMSSLNGGPVEELGVSITLL
jgi:hypothetical protein